MSIPPHCAAYPALALRFVFQHHFIGSFSLWSGLPSTGQIVITILCKQWIGPWTTFSTLNIVLPLRRMLPHWPLLHQCSVSRVSGLVQTSAAPTLAATSQKPAVKHRRAICDRLRVHLALCGGLVTRRGPSSCPHGRTGQAGTAAASIVSGWVV